MLQCGTHTYHYRPVNKDDMQDRKGQFDPLLVLPSISQTQTISTPVSKGLSGLVFYRKSLRILRDKVPTMAHQKTKSYRWEIRLAELDVIKTRSEINSFSRKSRSRLQFIVMNTNVRFMSQMTLTYDLKCAPVDGVVLKQHLNTYLTKLRKKFDGIKYLWILEFQGNGNPHFHVFLNLEYSYELAKILGSMWNQTVKGSEKHLQVHQYVPSHRYKRKLSRRDKHGSFCPWDMGDGSYLTYKYLSKENQKSVPPQFRNVGRFWGCTRSIVQPVNVLQACDFFNGFDDTLNTFTGEIISFEKHLNSFFRFLRKYQETSINRARQLDYQRQLKESEGRWKVYKPKKYRSPLRRFCDVTIKNGTSLYRQWFDSYMQEFAIPF